MPELFPRGIAYADAFYDRVNERQQLKQNIEHTIHTVLIAPRRFGKTSLMTHVLYENAIDHIWIDFMTITNKSELEHKLLQKIGELTVKTALTTEKLKELASKCFENLRPEILLKLPGVELKLHQDPRTSKENQSEGVVEILTNLDNLARELNRRLVVVLDEFQEILQIDPHAILQGSIRHAAERAQYVTYLFSGSKHQALRRMFSGKENPLYSLCEYLVLPKIPAAEYIAFINAAATKMWGGILDEAVMAKILSYSDCYPKYVNALCGTIWAGGEKPTSELIDKLWSTYVLAKKTDITEDLSDLTLNQRRLLQRLCLAGQTAELYSIGTLSLLGMSQSSVQKAAAVLLEKGWLVEEDGVYKVLDPLLISYFKMF